MYYYPSQMQPRTVLHCCIVHLSFVGMLWESENMRASFIVAKGF